MKSENAIEIKKISKSYRLGIINTGTLAHDINRWWCRIRGLPDPYFKLGEVNNQSIETKNNYVWALKNIDLDVKKGEILGIIGKNGAGKSTLLKILSRVTGPTSGQIHYKGKIGSLLEVGTGFHKELTGKENIFLNGAILGMSKKEINDKIIEIIDFSGCKKYIDTPVKRYSSGMIVRLGFSIAAYLNPDILVVDEVLAVGDIEFQKKAVGKIKEITNDKKRTVIFVSHNMSAVKSLCTSAVLIDQGSIIKKGNTDEIIFEYLKKNSSKSKILINNRIDRKGKGYVRFNNIELFDFNENKIEFIKSGQDIIFSLQFIIHKDIDYDLSNLHISIIIRDENGMRITTLSSFFTDESPEVTKKIKKVNCKVPKFPLLDGRYIIDLWCATSSIQQDYLENAMIINVESGNYFNSSHTWRPISKRHGAIVIPQSWDTIC